MQPEQNEPWPELMAIEDHLAAQLREEFRLRLERCLQAQVTAQEAQLPEVRELTRRRWVDLHLISTFGPIRLRVVKGYRVAQRQWIVPVRRAWRLADNQRLTPAFQR